MWIDNNKLYRFKSWKLLWHVLDRNHNYDDEFSFMGSGYKYVMNYYYKYSSPLHNSKGNKRSYIICG